MNFQAVNIRHHKVGETDEPAIYRIKDDLVSSVRVFVSALIRFTFVCSCSLTRIHEWSYMYPFYIIFAELLNESIVLIFLIRMGNRTFLLRFMNGLERAGSHMWLMTFKFSSIWWALMCWKLYQLTRRYSIKMAYISLCKLFTSKHKYLTSLPGFAGTILHIIQGAWCLWGIPI